MADPQDKGAWTGILPSSYQKDIDLAKRKQLLAQMMMAGKQPTQGQMVSGYYVPPAMTQHLSNLFGQLYGTKMLVDSQDAQSNAYDRFNKDQQAELAAILAEASPREGRMAGDVGQTNGTLDSADPPTQPTMVPGNLDAAVRRGLTSQFPLGRDLGTTLQKQQAAVWGKAADHSTPQSMAASGGQVGGLVPRTPTFERKDIEGVGTFGVATDDRGHQSIQGIQKPVVPPAVAFGEDIVKDEAKDLRTLRPKVEQLSNLQTATLEAFRTLKSGAMNTGAFANEVTQIQALSKFLGVPVPANVPATQFFNNELLPALTQALRAVNPVGASSNLELQTALQRAVSSNMDPRAIEALLVKAMQESQKGLQMYNDRVKTLSGWASENGRDPKLFESLHVPGGFKMGEDEYNAFFGQTPSNVAVPPGSPANPGGGGRRIHQPKKFGDLK